MPLHTFDSHVHAPGMKLPCRCVAVQEGNRVLLISPIQFTEDQIRAIHALGEVTDLVAPCLFHHLSMPGAIQLFPGAKVWGVPGFEKKRPDIPWTNTLTPETWPYVKFLDLLFIEGAPMYNEVDFFHFSTRTLITTDLCFNLRKPQGWAAGIILRMTGNYNGFAASRLLKMLVKDKPAFEKSLARLFQWDFDRILMNHGECLEADCKNSLCAALNARGFSIQMPRPTTI